MAIGFWRVWVLGRGSLLQTAAIVFGIQIVLNALWSGAFFALHQPALGLAVIAALLIAILWTMIAFAKIDRLAAWLYVPYFGWVCFATLLNAAIWRLN
jgi:benzodiazapine receptor